MSEYASASETVQVVPCGDYHVRTTCRLCGSTSLEKLLDLGQTPLANEYLDDQHASFKQDRFPLYLVGCGKCGHVQLPVVVRAERLFPPTYPYQSGTSPVFREHLMGLAADIMCQLDPPGSYGGTRTAHLDVACNDGTLVEMVRAHNRTSYGIDPCAPERPGYVRGFFGVDGPVTAFPNCQVLTALNVFAHVDDLDNFTRHVAKTLNQCGLFVFEVGYLPDVIEKRNYPVVYHEHLSYHHLTPLLPFFKRHGMTVVDAHRIDSQGGSIRVFVRNCEAFETPTDRMRALLDEENSPLRQGIATGVARLKDKAKTDCDRFAGFAKQIQSARGKIAGYGAPAKLCTTLHASKFYAGQLECVFDDNPLKVGKFVPGTQVPIVHSSELYERNPQGVILFSANFAEEIQKRHEKYQGRWLVA